MNSQSKKNKYMNEQPIKKKTKVRFISSHDEISQQFDWQSNSIYIISAMKVSKTYENFPV